jgi:PKD repeat protein
LKEIKKMKKSIVQHNFIKRAGGIFLAVLLLAVISILAFPQAGEAFEFESQCEGLVSPGKCAECHPKNNEGKCNLVADHKEKAGCITCHADCDDNAGPPHFAHIEICLGCHQSPHKSLDKVHKKHDAKGYLEEDDDFDDDDNSCIQCHSGKKILIAYESKHGSTQGYANGLAEGLCANGYQADVGHAPDLLEADVSAYDGVVVGSPTYVGIPLPGIKLFLDTHRSALATKPVAYMYNGLTGGETGNTAPFGFWWFAYTSLLQYYPDIFELEIPCIIPNTYFLCTTVPYYVGMMPGTYIPRDAFPTDYLAMELIGFGGGVKDYNRPAAATEFAQVLVNSNFFSDNPNAPPTVTATATPTSGALPSLLVNFTAVGIDPDGTLPLSYSWTFGDGTTSTEQNPVHTYTCNGDFKATVEVTDAGDGTGTDSVNISVAKLPGDLSLTYECDVDPIMQKCTGCHGTVAIGGLQLRTCEELQAGGDSGSAVTPGDRNASSLYYLIEQDGSGNYQMPPGGEPGPSTEEIETVGKWIDGLTGPDFCPIP